jgi:plastocyanin
MKDVFVIAVSDESSSRQVWHYRTDCRGPASNEAQGHPAVAGVAAKGERVSEHPPTLTGEAADGRAVDRQDNPYSAMLVVLAGGLAMAMIIFAVGFTVNRGGATVGASDGPAAAVPVSLTEFAISGPLEVAPGGSLAVTNDGAQVHNLVVEGAGGRTSDLAAGESETLELDLAEGQYELFCDIVGHRESGMETTLTVKAGASGEAAAGGGSDEHAGHSGMSYAEMDQMMEDSFAPFVDVVTSGEPNTEGLGGQDLEPTMSADGYKEWTLTAEIIDWEIAPGSSSRRGPTTAPCPGRPAGRGRRQDPGQADQRPAHGNRHPHARHDPAERAWTGSPPSPRSSSPR